MISSTLLSWMLDTNYLWRHYSPFSSMLLVYPMARWRYYLRSYVAHHYRFALILKIANVLQDHYQFKTIIIILRTTSPVSGMTAAEGIRCSNEHQVGPILLVTNNKKTINKSSNTILPVVKQSHLGFFISIFYFAANLFFRFLWNFDINFAWIPSKCSE